MEYTWCNTLGGVYSAEYTRWSTHSRISTLDGVRLMEYTRWNTIGGVWSTFPLNVFPTKYPPLSMFSPLKLQYLPLLISSSLKLLSSQCCPSPIPTPLKPKYFPLSIPSSFNVFSFQYSLFKYSSLSTSLSFNFFLSPFKP